MSNITNNPRVYVGTYAKYNNGSIAGDWIDLDDYADDKEGFLKACAELHKDEDDPEFMFQDFEGFPREFYGESRLSDELFTDWLPLDERERALLAMFCEASGYSGSDATWANAEESFAGTADSPADFAEQTAEDCGDIPSWIVIDWEASWNCNLRHDYHSPVRNDEDGLYYFFRSI